MRWRQSLQPTTKSFIFLPNGESEKSEGLQEHLGSAIKQHSKNQFQETSISFEFLDHKVQVGSKLALDLCTRLVKLLKEHHHCFTWSHKDMTRIAPSIVTHKLQVDPNHLPIKQKRRKFAAERNWVINEKVQKLFDNRFIREVSYPDWLANVVVVKKKNGKPRVCIEFTDLNKACPKDPFSLAHIHSLVDATAGHNYTDSWTCLVVTTRSSYI